MFLKREIAYHGDVQTYYSFYLITQYMAESYCSGLFSVMCWFVVLFVFVLCLVLDVGCVYGMSILKYPSLMFIYQLFFGDDASYATKGYVEVYLIKDR
jgi:hypothetical protein